MLLVFYDDTCAFCREAVAFVKGEDKQNICQFYALSSEKAQPYRSEKETVILVEEGGRKWFYAKAVFRLLWLLGGKWAMLGWLYILPSWLIDPLYRFVAKQRLHLKN